MNDSVIIENSSDSRHTFDWRPPDGHLTFRRIDFDKIPSEVFGIYGLWFRKRCIYVGKAEKQSIVKRLQQHWKGSHNEYLADWIKAKGPELRVKYIPVQKTSIISGIEVLYIRNLQPLTNKIQK
ncbi:MAG: hypothetical protein OXD37_03300 [Acidimicrobiaceae bacterium]|nr:hypothetical protein [Acidimicrobiaceae bacterium]